MKTGKFNMNVMLLMFALIPLFCGGLTVTIFLSEMGKSEIKTVTHNYMYSMAEDEGEALYGLAEVEGMDAALAPEALADFCAGKGLKDVSSSYIYVADADANMLYHKDESKIGQPVSNDVIKGVCAEMAAGATIETAVVEYKYNGSMKYASYYVAPDNSFVLVVSADESDVLSGVKKMVVYASIISLGILFLFILIALYFAKVVATPIRAVTDRINCMAEGNLNSTLPIKSIVTETVTLIRASDTLQSHLREVIDRTQTVSNELETGANTVFELSDHTSRGVDQISSAMEDLANGASSMAESVQNINSNIISMGMSVETIANNTENLVQSSNDIKAATQDADSYMKRVSDSSQQSVDSVHKISVQISETSEAIKSIERASDVISEIASQTNLLSLNASIEAARAGDAGRGFAVVASEIQQLAEQSNKSANDIKEIVQNITIQSDKTVELSAEIANIITEEQGYIVETQKKFDILADNIDRSLNQIDEIASKIDDLNSVKASITSEVQDLSAISEENAASNEEVSASVINIAESIREVHNNSNETKSLTVELNDAVSYFN